MLGLLRNVAAALAELRTVLSAPLDDGWELDGGQVLTEREAETEVLEPRTDCGMGGMGDAGRAAAEAFTYSLDDVAKLGEQIWADRFGEPPLTPSEIVAVRQLIEERFPLNSSSAAFASSADESAPARLKQTGPPGPSNLTAADLRGAALAAREAAARFTDEGPNSWDALADKLYAAAKTLTQ
jgi:hypothetical protein